MKITRLISDPIKNFSSWEDRWRGEDKGLISSWQTGRQKSLDDDDLACRARAGELVVLVWKGGTDRYLKINKFGSLNYLAMWQGLRGENLDIDIIRGETLTCTKTGTTVIYTDDLQKLSNI